MRIVKTQNPILKKTLPALVISKVLLDLRNLCSNIETTNPSPTAVKIYNFLKQTNQVFLFQTFNFDSDLLATCIRNVQIGSIVPAYLEFNPFDRLENLQSLVLRKFNIPIYPSTNKHHLLSVLNELMEKGGDNNENWE